MTRSALTLVGALWLLLEKCSGFSTWSLRASNLEVRRSPKCRLFASRREVFLSLGGLTAAVALPGSSQAAITDETASFGNTAKDSSYGFQDFVDDVALQTQPQPTTETSDEVDFRVAKSDITKGGLGIELGQVSFRTNTRVFVKSVLPDSLGSRLGIEKDYVFVAINEQSVERTNADGVVQYLSQAVKGTSDDGFITLRFRNPGAFREKLTNLSEGEAVTTQVAPGGDTTQRNQDGSVKFGRSVTEQEDQRLTVSQLIPPRMCNRKATTDDLLEISYLGTVVETGEVFDGSAVKIDGKAIPGRGNDVSLFFVLGKQPFGQFPPGWDVGIEGMCVGERRRLVIPPVLAYGSKGLPRRGIPPDATLQYDITLISINGLAIPQ